MEDATSYSIVLTPEELVYLRTALDTRIEAVPSSEHLLLAVQPAHNGCVFVQINETAYELIQDLRFGGSQYSKDWTRVEATV